MTERIAPAPATGTPGAPQPSGPGLHRWQQHGPGFGARVGIGLRPALVIIDMQLGYTDPRYVLGADQAATIAAIAPILALVRQEGMPVIYIVTGYLPDGSDGGMLVRKIPALLEHKLGTRAMEITPELAPLPGEQVIHKKFPSAFFGTSLGAVLARKDIDTMILAGCSTSGCIRATAVDGISSGFRVVVPPEAVFDRWERQHWATLFDIDAKFGDVMSARDVMPALEAVAAAQAVLPAPPKNERPLGATIAAVPPTRE
jgi:maleamate amidohydrolase